MFAFLRLLILLLICLTPIYWGLSLYARRRCRARLERRWHDKGLTSGRQAFIQRGLRRYDRSFRRRLVLLVYILPLGVIALVVYLVNFS